LEEEMQRSLRPPVDISMLVLVLMLVLEPGTLQ
jgi:hypothetical protein